MTKFWGRMVRKLPVLLHRGVSLTLLSVVYEHPTLTKLAEYIAELQSGSGATTSDASQHDLMLKMVDKWAAQLSTKKAAGNAGKDSQVVVSCLLE